MVIRKQKAMQRQKGTRKEMQTETQMQRGKPKRKEIRMENY